MPPVSFAALSIAAVSADPIDALQSIYATQWAVIERPGASQLMVCSSFDRSWEDYFHLLVDRTGPLLDALFCLTDPGDEVVLTDPTYAGMLNRVRLVGA
jgi:hypothetical protein